MAPTSNATTSERVLRATSPMIRPVITPLMVEPITILTMIGLVSGADSSAVSPSKIPRNPPSAIPNIGLVILASPPRVQSARTLPLRGRATLL